MNHAPAQSSSILPPIGVHVQPSVVVQARWALGVQKHEQSTEKHPAGNEMHVSLSVPTGSAGRSRRQ